MEFVLDEKSVIINHNINHLCKNYSASDLKVLQEWFETNRIRETGIIENVQKQPASTERDEMLEICKGNVEEFSMLIQLVASIIEREKE